MLLYVKKRANSLERFVLYTNLIISNFITCIYRKLTLNYSKLHMKITKHVSFMKILQTPGFFCYGMQDERGDSLHYLKSWLDSPCHPIPPPSTNLLWKVFDHFDEKPTLPTVDLSLKALYFLPFQIISNYNISLRSF